jgi:thioredoxin 1
MMATDILDLTADTFDEAIHSASLPVLVDVWAQWCPPCKAIAPVLEAIAADFHDRIHIYKINNDDYPSVVSGFGVMAVPTLLVFADGELVNRLVGARGKARLIEELGEVLNRGA